MPIRVRREPRATTQGFNGLREDCCFCWQPTLFWTTKKESPAGQVACCEACAQTHQPADLPTKEEWCEAAERRLPSLRFGRMSCPGTPQQQLAKSPAAEFNRGAMAAWTRVLNLLNTFEDETVLKADIYKAVMAFRPPDILPRAA